MQFFIIIFNNTLINNIISSKFSRFVPSTVVIIKLFILTLPIVSNCFNLRALVKTRFTSVFIRNYKLPIE